MIRLDFESTFHTGDLVRRLINPFDEFVIGQDQFIRGNVQLLEYTEEGKRWRLLDIKQRTDFYSVANKLSHFMPHVQRFRPMFYQWTNIEDTQALLMAKFPVRMETWAYSQLMTGIAKLKVEGLNI